MCLAGDGDADTAEDVSATRTSEVPSERARVRCTRVEDVPVCALRVESRVSVEERWRRSCVGLGKAEGGERVSARCVSRESTDGVRSWCRSIWSSGCLMLAGGEGGGGPTGAFSCWSDATTCMTWFGSRRAGRGVSGVSGDVGAVQNDVATLVRCDVEITSAMAGGQVKHGGCTHCRSTS